jgi:hypothetical protein
MTPDKVQARKMVLVSLLVLALISVYRDRKHTGATGPSGDFRVLWGVGVVGMFLSLLADFLPQIAGPFAGLVALGSLTNGGEQVLERALSVISPAPAAGSGSSPSSPPGQSKSPSPPSAGRGTP